MSVNGLLEWDVTWDWAQKECEIGINNFIIIYQTGISVHHFLHVFLLSPLTLRIREDSLSLLLSCTALGLTTFIQDDPDCVWLFNENRVRHLDSNLPWMEIRDLRLEEFPAWTLVDSNLAVLQGVYISSSIGCCHLTGIARREFGSTPAI